MKRKKLHQEETAEAVAALAVGGEAAAAGASSAAAPAEAGATASGSAKPKKEKPKKEKKEKPPQGGKKNICEGERGREIDRWEKASDPRPPLFDLDLDPETKKKIFELNKNTAGAAGKKKETKLGLSAPKATNFSDWYTEALLASEMVSYYDVSGCYILRPWSFSVWESITAWFDSKIKALGVKNAYFPLFITEDRLNTEKDHVEGVRCRFPFLFFCSLVRVSRRESLSKLTFPLSPSSLSNIQIKNEQFSAEVAWVTKSGNSELDRPIAIRPTSETVM